MAARPEAERLAAASILHKNQPETGILATFPVLRLRQCQQVCWFAGDVRRKRFPPNTLLPRWARLATWREITEDWLKKAGVSSWERPHEPMTRRCERNPRRAGCVYMPPSCTCVLMPPASFPRWSGRHAARASLVRCLTQAPNIRRSLPANAGVVERGASQSHIASHNAADRSVQRKHSDACARNSAGRHYLPEWIRRFGLGFRPRAMATRRKTLHTPRLFGSGDITFPSTTFPHPSIWLFVLAGCESLDLCIARAARVFPVGWLCERCLQKFCCWRRSGASRDKLAHGRQWPAHGRLNQRRRAAAKQENNPPAGEAAAEAKHTGSLPSREFRSGELRRLEQPRDFILRQRLPPTTFASRLSAGTPLVASSLSGSVSRTSISECIRASKPKISDKTFAFAEAATLMRVVRICLATIFAGTRPPSIILSCAIRFSSTLASALLIGLPRNHIRAIEAAEKSNRPGLGQTRRALPRGERGDCGRTDRCGPRRRRQRAGVATGASLRLTENAKLNFPSRCRSLGDGRLVMVDEGGAYNKHAAPQAVGALARRCFSDGYGSSLIHSRPRMGASGALQPYRNRMRSAAKGRT